MRLDRVKSLLKQEIALIVQKRILSSKHGLVSLQSLTISSDLSSAKVYFSVLGHEEQKKEAIIILKKSAGFIKKELGKVITLKTIPDLRFILDDSIERGFRVVEKLKTLS